MSRFKIMLPVVLFAALCLFVSQAFAVALRINVPEKRADGTPIVLGVKEYYVCQWDKEIPTGGIGADCTMVIPSPEPFPTAGTVVTSGQFTCTDDPCFLRVGVRDTSGRSSALSNEVIFTEIPLEAVTISIVITPPAASSRTTP